MLEDTREKKLWAFFDKDWNYVGGLVKLGKEPPTKEENNRGYHFEEVERFPGSAEIWNQKHGGWIVDTQRANTLERVVQYREASREDFASLVMEDVQKWMLETLRELGIEVNAEQEARLFPLVKTKEDQGG